FFGKRALNFRKKAGSRPFFQRLELVPKLIDCALKRTVLDRALAVFQAKALQNCVFKGCCSKTSVLEQPRFS
ncbi:MAG: hypothetical protein LBP23_01495, partial [Treponema sp.]|nr:hypothetical protein [Treponema sp.]